MSEKAPNVAPEVLYKPELPPRDEAIDAMRGEIADTQTRLKEAEEKVRTPGFKADANEIIQNRAELRELREHEEPRLNGLREMWSDFGGEDIDRAQAEVDALNFKSDASDRVAAQLALRDAKDAFYARMEAERDATYEEADKMNKAEDEKRLSPLDADNITKIGDYIKNNPDSQETSRLVAELTEIMRQIQDSIGPKETTVPVKYLDEKTALNEAYDEYDLRSGSEYDVDKGRVKDKNAAHIKAIDMSKERVTDAERTAAHVEAIEEAKRRVTPNELEAAHEEAIEESKRRVTSSELDAAHTEAIEEAKRRVTPEEYAADHQEALNIERDNRPLRRAWRRLNVLLTPAILFERAKEHKVATGVIAAGILAVGTYFALKQGGIFDHDSTQAVIKPRIEDTSIPTVEHFSPAAHEASRGEGWNQQLSQMGIPKSEQGGVKEQLLNSKDPAIRRWVYRMRDGQPGIARPGKIPQGVLESISKLRNR